MWGGIEGMTRRESLRNRRWVTVGFDGGEDLIFEADLLDVLDIRVPREEELVSEHEVRLLSSLLAIHGGCRPGGWLTESWTSSLGFLSFWLFRFSLTVCLCALLAWGRRHSEKQRAQSFHFWEGFTPILHVALLNISNATCSLLFFNLFTCLFFF